MTTLDDIDSLAAEYVASVAAGGYEPDGVGLAFGIPSTNDPDALGYGRDLRCRTDCDALMSEVDENSPEAVADALCRMLNTNLGGIIADPELLIAVGEDPDYGYNLSRLLHVGMSEIERLAHQDLAATACERDPRVAKATVTITQLAGDTFEVRLFGELKTGERYAAIVPLNTDTISEVLA